jgi:hypothetical protein
MSDPIEQKVNLWDQTGDNNFRQLNLQINHLNDRLYHDYEPTLGPSASFVSRLATWLDNLHTEDDQKILFELVPNIFYVGREEFNVLYREAYNIRFARWLIDDLKIDITDPNANTLLKKGVENTWFCPLTDSLRINQFYHVNNIPAKYDFRPDWRSLVKFGDPTKIRSYIHDHAIERIVLLEDFIGNGGQVSKAVNFAVQQFPEIPILIVPLIICPNGVENARDLLSKHKNVSISPVIALPQSSFVNENTMLGEPELHNKLRELAERSYLKVSNSSTVDDNIDPYGPYGWRKTGGLVVMYTNTPNNTLPLIHHLSGTWNPLFKRHKRV